MSDNLDIEVLFSKDNNIAMCTVNEDTGSSKSSYETDRTLEFSLKKLGYAASDPIDWKRTSLSEKTNMRLEIMKRIVEKKNADCKVYVGGQRFQCHLIVLQCYSEVFDGLSTVKKIEIPSNKCSAASFSFIYDWMIREQDCCKFLNRVNVLDIMIAANYLKIKELVQQCTALIDNTDVFKEDTAFFLYADAKSKGLEDVRQMMIPRIQKFFLILVSSQDWLELDVDDVKTFLSSNSIRINCEMEIFMSAVRWLRFDLANRDKFKQEILKCVRFGNFAAWQLIDIKRNLEHPELMKLVADPVVRQLLDDGLAYVVVHSWNGDDKRGDYKQRKKALGLQEPQDRNWTGLDKTYCTFREFLDYLDQYRKHQTKKKSKLLLAASSVGKEFTQTYEKPLTSKHKLLPRSNVTLPSRIRRDLPKTIW